MATSSGSGHVTARTITVIALSVALLAIELCNLQQLWHPFGVFGYGTNVDGVVTGVNAGSPASAAGIDVGDRLDESKMTPMQLEELIQFPEVASPGESRTFDVLRKGARRTVTLVSVPEPFGPTNVAVIIAEVIGSLVFITIGSAVLLLKPETSTWGFYFFCLGFAPVNWDGIYTVVNSAPGVQIIQVIFGIVQTAGFAGLLVFALNFLQPKIGGWRKVLQFFVPVIFLTSTALNTIVVINTYYLAKPAEAAAHGITALEVVCAAIVVIALIDTLVRRHGAERQRIRWVVLGFAVALIVQTVWFVLVTEVTTLPLYVYSLENQLSIFAPLAVAYAIVKHRVIDVNFVISRTLVYGILTTLFIGLFAFIDWFVGRVLDQTRWALIAEIAVAIGVGFWLNGVHTRVDRFVDSVLFRRRHEAERRLARLARGLPHATSAALVDASLVAEPRDALDLASAAMFRRDGSAHYVRTIAAGWGDGMASDLGEDDPLILHLQAERGALRLSELHWARGDAPSGTGRPALALPIVVRHELDAIVLFGGHRGGEDFDLDEIGWLNSLASAAGAAYDHLEADALREELERVKRERDAQRAVSRAAGVAAVEMP